MSLDSSLKVKGALTRHRNVLTRAERVEKLKEEEKWEEGTSVMGLPKVAHRKTHAGKKEAKEEAAVAGVPGAAVPAPGAAPAGAAGATKAGAPVASGAKVAAGAKAGAGAPAKAGAAPAKSAGKQEKPGKK